MAATGAWAAGTGDAGKGYTYGASPPTQHQHQQHPPPQPHYAYQQHLRPPVATSRGSATIRVLSFIVAALGLASMGLEIAYLRLAFDPDYIPDVDCYPIATGVWAGGLLVVCGSVGAAFARRPRGEGPTKVALGVGAAVGYAGFVAALVNAYFNTFTCVYASMNAENSFAVWVPLVVAGLTLKAGVLATVGSSMACCGCCGGGRDEPERGPLRVVMVPGGSGEQPLMYGTQAGVVVNTSYSNPDTSLYYNTLHQTSTAALSS